MYILGIDGGGTATRTEQRLPDGQCLRRSYGPFNPNTIGQTAFRERIRAIFADCGGAADCAAVCIGGAGRSGGAMETLLRDCLAELGFAGELLLCGDHEIALAGSGTDAVLIAGTGSIACCRDALGQLHRCGGFGHLVDDGGSGYDLGRAALHAVLEALDGRRPHSPLTHALLQQLQAASAEDIVRYVYQNPQGKAAVAALAPTVIACAGEDPLAEAILHQGIRELTRLTDALLIHLENRPTLALRGGLLESDSKYTQMLCQALLPRWEIVPAAHDALWGAAQLACTLRKG